MAKLGVAYGLCPLIDEKSLVGITDDALPGTVLVTLGRNIVIRYKLQDQKQIGSWSTKSKLTSPVIYDKAGNQYVGVFHYNHIRTWTENDERLDKTNKVKFQEPISSILLTMDVKTPVVLFKNGSVLPLEMAIQKRKEGVCAKILAANEEIENSYSVSSEGRNFIAFIARNTKNNIFLYVVPVIGSQNEIKKIALNRNEPEITLKGCTVIQEASSCQFFSLWSDGKLFSLKILPTFEEECPGTFVHTVSTLNTKNPVVLIPLNNKYLMLYGADPSEEGAFMLVLNLQFRLVQSRLHFKLFSPQPQVWRVQSALLLPVGLNLVVVPFRLGDEHISTLLGTTLPLSAEAGISPIAIADWGTGCDTNTKQSEMLDIFTSAPVHLREKLQSSALDGWPQALILREILPHLIEKKDVKSIDWCVKHFTDIPEVSIVQLLSFCLLEADSVFDSGGSTSATDSLVIMNGQLDHCEDDVGSNKTVKINPLQPAGRMQLLESVLSSHFSDAKLIAHLRLLPLSGVLLLLRHLVYMLQQKASDVKLLDWACMLLDAHYQQLLLSKDNEVAQLLGALHQTVIVNLSCVEDLKISAAILQQLKAGKPFKRKQCSNKVYSIETLRLY